MCDAILWTLITEPSHFDFISSRRQGAVYVRKNYTVAEYPEELKRKVYLLKHFEQYIMGRLYGAYEWTFDDFERTKGMEFVQKYLRMKAVIIFKMSHDVLQVSCILFPCRQACSRATVQLLRPHKDHPVVTGSCCDAH